MEKLLINVEEKLKEFKYPEKNILKIKDKVTKVLETQDTIQYEVPVDELDAILYWDESVLEFDLFGHKVVCDANKLSDYVEEADKKGEETVLLKFKKEEKSFILL